MITSSFPIISSIGCQCLCFQLYLNFNIGHPRGDFHSACLQFKLLDAVFDHLKMRYRSKHCKQHPYDLDCLKCLLMDFHVTRKLDMNKLYDVLESVRKNAHGKNGTDLWIEFGKLIKIVSIYSGIFT